MCCVHTWANGTSYTNTFDTYIGTSGYPWPSDTVRRKRNVPAPSLLKLQRERRETTELGYSDRCRRQPRKHMGHVPIHPWQRTWFMARDPSLRGETGLRHRPGLILTPAIPHTWTPPSLGQVFFYHSGLWSLGVGTWDLDWGDSFKNDLGFRTSTDNTPARSTCTQAPSQTDVVNLYIYKIVWTT